MKMNTLTRKTYAKLPTTAMGYVIGARCDLRHSGNRGIVQRGTHCECQGCGKSFRAADVFSSIANKTVLR